MTDEDRNELRKQHFITEASRIGAQVQMACMLAAELDSPVQGFDVIHMLLNKYIAEVSLFEARISRRSAEAEPKPSAPDGN